MIESKYPCSLEVDILGDKKQDIQVRYVMYQLVLSPKEGEIASGERRGLGLGVSGPLSLGVCEFGCLCVFTQMHHDSL